MKKITLLLLFSLLDGCATSEQRGNVRHMNVPQDVERGLQNAPICCQSFESFPYMNMEFGKSYDRKIDINSPSFQFKSGKSFFIAFRLPTVAKPWTISIKSYFWGYAFYPAATLLDEKFVPTRHISNPQFHYVEPGFIERGHIGGTINFNGNETDRYLIIHTRDADMQGELHKSESGYAYSTGSGPVIVPGGDYAHHFGPTGSLEISSFTSK